MAGNKHGRARFRVEGRGNEFLIRRSPPVTGVFRRSGRNLFIGLVKRGSRKLALLGSCGDGSDLPLLPPHPLPLPALSFRAPVLRMRRAPCGENVPIGEISKVRR